MITHSLFSFILFIFISTICYVVAWYISLLGVKIYYMIVDSLKWNDEPITIGDLMKACFMFDILSWAFIPFGIGFLIVSIMLFFGFIVVGLFQKKFKKLKNNYKFPNIRNIRIG